MLNGALPLAITEAGVGAFFIIAAVAICAAITGVIAILILGRWSLINGLRGLRRMTPRVRMPSALVSSAALALSLLVASVVLQSLILIRLNSPRDTPVVLHGVAMRDYVPVSIQDVSTADELPVSLSATSSVEVSNTVKVDIDDQSLITPLPVHVE